MMRGLAMGVLPERDREKDLVTTSIRVSKSMLAKLDLIAGEEHEDRTWVIRSFLKYAIEAYEQEKRGKK